MTSSSVPVGFVQQFKSNLYFGAQQKGSRLRNFCRMESQQGETAYYDGLGPTSASRLIGRNQDTIYVDVLHLRRSVSLKDYAWSALVDNADKLRMLNDPTSGYSKNAQMALGRSIDDEIVGAALGTAYTGVAGGTSTILPASQWVGACTAAAAKSNLNLLTLIRVKSKFGINDVDDEGGLHIAVTQSQIDALLQTTEVSSADYNAVKALVHGEIDTFMGFKFHRLQRLPTGGTGGFLAEITEATGAVTLSTGDGNNLRRCFAWQEDGILLAIGQDMEAKIDQLPGKNYSTQVYARMSIGATRMLEEKVVGIICTES